MASRPNPSISGAHACITTRSTLGSPRPDPLALCIYLGGTRSHSEGCVSHRILSISQCQTIRKLYTSGRPRVNANPQPGPSISGTAHAQFAEGLHFSARARTHENTYGPGCYTLSKQEVQHRPSPFATIIVKNLLPLLGKWNH